MRDYPLIPPRFYGDARLVRDCVREAEPRVRFAGALAAVVLAIGLAIFLAQIGSTLMKKLPLVASVLATLALCACAPLQQLVGGDRATPFLQHLETCDRHYEGAIGAGVNGSFRIDCKAQPATALQPGSLVGGTPPEANAPDAH